MKYAIIEVDYKGYEPKLQTFEDEKAVLKALETWWDNLKQDAADAGSQYKRVPPEPASLAMFIDRMGDDYLCSGRDGLKQLHIYKAKAKGWEQIL